MLEGKTSLRARTRCDTVGGERGLRGGDDVMAAQWSEQSTTLPPWFHSVRNRGEKENGRGKQRGGGLQRRDSVAHK